MNAQRVSPPMIENKKRTCDCSNSYLDEVRIGNVYYPVIFECQKCGQLFICECFENYFDIQDDICRLLLGGLLGKSKLRKRAENIKIIKNICHLCTKTIPKFEYGSPMYYSSFLQRFRPYYYLYQRKMDTQEKQLHISKLQSNIDCFEKKVVDLINLFIKEGKETQMVHDAILPPKYSDDPKLNEYLKNDYLRNLKNMLLHDYKYSKCQLEQKYRGLIKEYFNAVNELDEYIKADNKQIENTLRKKFNYPLIGEGWLSETTLFKIVQTLFLPKDVIHHYRGKELEGLEIDIWVPDLKLGIEYQGEQHYKVIEHWGGEEGLKKRMENDREKRKLCKTHGYHLVEFKCNEELTEENVRQKLMKFLP